MESEGGQVDELKFTVEKGRVQIIIDVPAVSHVNMKDLATIADILWYLAKGMNQDGCVLMYERSRINEDISATLRKKIVT